jgi:murein DD-endopeptidase MepM/ murein hydrolase activator NlpD
LKLQTRIDLTSHALQRFASRHRRTLVSAAITVLAGFGLTAVATVAVSPLMPEPALLPQRTVVETLRPADLSAQLEALAGAELSLTRSDVTRSTDSPEALLARLGVVDASAADFLRRDVTARTVMAGRGGKPVQATTDADGVLQSLVARFPAPLEELQKTHFSRLTITRSERGWRSRLETAPFEAQMRLASGTVRSSLYAATDESGIPDAVAAQIAEIFAADIDFHRELRKGDTFHLVYETLTADGEPVPWNGGIGRVLAAEFVNGGRTYQALWFAGADGRGGYYTPDGQSKRRTFLASPMEFSRVTSGFAMRMHPLQQTLRKHNGVDYSAPNGTPVRSVADGTVDFAGWQNGYGNVVELQHGGGKSTLYAHLSRIDVRKGQRVQQGQHIGAVGATGWATGPHLHFEFRAGGVHQDPLLAAKSSPTLPIDAASRPRFDEQVRVVQAKLDVAETLPSGRSLED